MDANSSIGRLPAGSFSSHLTDKSQDPAAFLPKQSGKITSPVEQAKNAEALAQSNCKVFSQVGLGISRIFGAALLTVSMISGAAIGAAMSVPKIVSIVGGFAGGIVGALLACPIAIFSENKLEAIKTGFLMGAKVGSLPGGVVSSALAIPKFILSVPLQAIALTGLVALQLQGEYNVSFKDIADNFKHISLSAIHGLENDIRGPLGITIGDRRQLQERIEAIVESVKNQNSQRNLLTITCEQDHAKEIKRLALAIAMKESGIGPFDINKFASKQEEIAQLADEISDKIMQEFLKKNPELKRVDLS